MVTTGKVLTKKHAYYCKISIFAKNLILNSIMRKLLWICLLLIASIAAKSQEQSEFTVLQWNIWQEGTKVTGGYDAIVDEIIRLKPDFVTFSEVRNYNNTIGFATVSSNH